MFSVFNKEFKKRINVCSCTSIQTTTFCFRYCFEFHQFLAACNSSNTDVCPLRCRKRRRSAISKGMNTAAQLVVGRGKFSHVTPILKGCPPLTPCTISNQIQNRHTILHWPVTVFTFGIFLTYFDDVSDPVSSPVADAPGRTNLRSATRGDLLIPRSQTKLWSLFVNCFKIICCFFERKIPP